MFVVCVVGVYLSRLYLIHCKSIMNLIKHMLTVKYFLNSSAPIVVVIFLKLE